MLSVSRPSSSLRATTATPVAALAAVLATLLAVGLMTVCLMTVCLPAPASHAAEPGPIHAGNTFGWYPYAQHFEFERWGAPKPLTGDWQTRGRSSERGGQLTLSASHGRSTTVTLRGAGHRTGRWELRWHGYSLGSDANHYRMTSSLVPAGASARGCGCGPDLTFQDVTMPQSRAGLTISPDATGPSYTASTASRGESFGGREHWHTFAVEVTRARISWFVDARVIATEARPAAMIRVPLTVQLRLAPTTRGRGDRARMQLDWLRYWTLRKPDTRSIKAPAPHASTHASTHASIGTAQGC